MVETVYRSVKRVCYAGLDSVSLRREVAARVARVVALDAHAFETTDPDTWLITHVVAEGIPEPLVATYLAHLYPEEAQHRECDMLRRGRLIFSLSDGVPSFAAALRAHGLDHELQVLLGVGERLWGKWCLLRGKRSPRVYNRERAFLERLVPHLARGIQSAALVDGALDAARRPASPAPVPGTAPGVLILDAHHRPTLRTEIAAAYLSDLADVGLDAGWGIPLAIVALAARVRARHGIADVDAPDARVRARGQSGRWYTIRASLAEPDAAGECAAVIVVQPAVPREVAAILTRLYDLSAREREVVSAITRGESTKHIAARLGVSPHTVAEHIDRACEKIGVRGRKALVARLFFDGYMPSVAEERPRLTSSHAGRVQVTA